MLNSGIFQGNPLFSKTFFSVWISLAVLNIAQRITFLIKEAERKVYCTSTKEVLLNLIFVSNVYKKTKQQQQKKKYIVEFREFFDPDNNGVEKRMQEKLRIYFSWNGNGCSRLVKNSGFPFKMETIFYFLYDICILTVFHSQYLTDIQDYSFSMFLLFTYTFLCYFFLEDKNVIY